MTSTTVLITEKGCGRSSAQTRRTMTVMGPEVAAGLFSLGGVLVGAFAATGTQLFLEVKRDRREAERAKKLVAGELLRAQMIFRLASDRTTWPPVADVDVHLPTSAWQQYRVLLTDAVDAGLWEALVMAYALLEVDRERFASRAGTQPLTPMSASEAAGLRKTALDLGRLRRRLWDAGSWWLDEIAEEFKPTLESLVEELGKSAPPDDAVIAGVEDLAKRLADMSPGSAEWLAEIRRRLARVNAGGK